MKKVILVNKDFTTHIIVNEWSYTCNKLHEITNLFFIFSPTRLLPLERHKMQRMTEKTCKQTSQRRCQPNREARKENRYPMDHMVMPEQTKNGIHMQYGAVKEMGVL